MGAPGFWDNQEKAQQAVGELKSLRSLMKPIGAALAAAGDLGGLIEMAEEDDQHALHGHQRRPPRHLQRNQPAQADDAAAVQSNLYQTRRV